MRGYNQSGDSTGTLVPSHVTRGTIDLPEISVKGKKQKPHYFVLAGKGSQTVNFENVPFAAVTGGVKGSDVMFQAFSADKNASGTVSITVSAKGKMAAGEPVTLKWGGKDVNYATSAALEDEPESAPDRVTAEWEKPGVLDRIRGWWRPGPPDFRPSAKTLPSEALPEEGNGRITVTFRSDSESPVYFYELAFVQKTSQAAAGSLADAALRGGKSTPELAGLDIRKFGGAEFGALYVSERPPDRRKERHARKEEGTSEHQFGVIDTTKKNATQVGLTEFNKAWDKLDPQKFKRVVVFVHGFNNSMADAVTSLCSIIAAMSGKDENGKDMDDPHGKKFKDGREFVASTAFICYDWESVNKLWAYTADRDNIEEWTKLRNFLPQLHHMAGGRPIHFIAHSMGTDYLWRSLQRLDQDHRDIEAGVAFNNVVLVAADKGIETLRPSFTHVSRRINRLTNFYNASDAVLAMGAHFWPISDGKGAKVKQVRLGSVDMTAKTMLVADKKWVSEYVNGLDAIDVSTDAYDGEDVSSWMGHAYFDSYKVAARIVAALKDADASGSAPAPAPAPRATQA